jgi:UDP-glucose 4-epimerase
MRDFVHVRDLASAHIAALNYLLAGGKSDDFNLGSGLGHSVLEVVHAIERITATKMEITHSPRRLGDPVALVCDPSKARKILQWVPQYSDLDVIVHDAAAWDALLYSSKEVSLV